MQDVQNRQDKRGIAIQKVGIKEAHLPFLIKTKEGGYQQVLARVRFTVALPSQYKGTHMSRFLEILMPWSKKPLAETEMEAGPVRAPVPEPERKPAPFARTSARRRSSWRILRSTPRSCPR